MAKILVIDAHTGNHQNLMTLLSSEQHNLFVATDTAQALAIVRKENLDLIVVQAKASGEVDVIIDKTDSSEDILKQIYDLIHQQKEAKLSLLSHNLSQPLMVMSAYVNGCIRRLEENVFDKSQIIDAMKIVSQHIDHAGKLIHRHKK